MLGCEDDVSVIRNEFLFITGIGIILIFISSACSNAPAITSYLSLDLTDLFDKKWVFQYAIENGEETMEYQRIIEKDVWITLSSQLHSEKPCKNIFTESIIPNDGRCLYSYDGCNESWGVYSISEDGKFKILASYSELVGCPVQINTQTNLETQELEFVIGPEIYNSDPFTEAFDSAVNVEVNLSELKLYYPSTQQNYLLFHLEENQ